MKDYLGDSVYAESNGDRIILTTEDGVGISNTIYLEPEVLQALVRFYTRMIGEANGTSA